MTKRNFLGGEIGLLEDLKEKPFHKVRCCFKVAQVFTK